jgi:membrane fusion protein (multidrug efflux system)
VKRRTIMIIAGILAIALMAYGIFKREWTVKQLKGAADDQATLPVQIIAPQRGPPTRTLVLPASVQAWYEATIFGQVTGYVSSWKEDYGATVKKGQLLATIEAPGLDAQYAAAQASLNVAQANYELAVSTAKRWQALAGTPAVSQQSVDVQTAAAKARKADLEAAEQDVARYAALESFKRVLAPFDGIVTARLTNVGAYVNAGGGDAGARTGATQLFTVSDVHKLRVFVDVPQSYAGQLDAQASVTIHLPSQPDKQIPATFLTTARAFSDNSRTAVTELTVDHADGTLWPGTFVEAVFQLANDSALLTLPEEALIFRAQGLQVALVDAHNRVHLQNIALGENLGETVQVLSGLTPDARVVNNPPAGLLEGQLVQSVTPAPGYADESKSAATAQSPPPPPISPNSRTPP